MLEDLRAMAVFAHVVRLGSFSAAAKALDLSKSAVSRDVSRLEEHLGARLLHRTTRKLSLTEAGAEVYERADRILAEAESAELAVSWLTDAPRGTLRLDAPVVFGERHVVPVVNAFLEAYPEVSVALTLTDRFVDLVEERIDVAIRIAVLGDSPNLMARKLMSDRRVVVASPDYLRRRGTPEVPADLAHHDAVRHDHAAGSDDWSFVVDGREVTIPARGRLVCNHGGAMHAAVLAGQGIAVFPWSIAWEGVGDGRLVSILEPFVPQRATGVWAIWPTARQRSTKVRAFVDFIGERLGPGA